MNCSNEVGGGGGEELDATTTQNNIKEEPKPNLDQVIDNIQIEPIVYVEHVISIIELVDVATKSFQFFQHIVEHVRMENPQFFRFQLVIISNHSIKILSHINMILEQVVQNATTWLGTL